MFYDKLKLMDVRLLFLFSRIDPAAELLSSIKDSSH